MADLSITAASVLASATALKASGTAGATITAGQPVYIDTADSNKIKVADANASAATAAVAGISLHGASSGQPITYAFDDSAFTPGATLATGNVYVAAANVGAICPVADLVSGDFPAVLFVAKSTTQAVLKIVRGGVARP